MKNLIFIILLITVVISTSFAQTPQVFNYQLIARDTAGLVLADRTLGLQISILPDNAYGIPVYTEQHTATSNSYGLVNLGIGTGSVVYGNFNSIAWGEHPYFLKLEIDPSGGTDFFTMGIIQLVSVPYSLYAEKAAALTDTNKVSKWTQDGNNIYNKNSGNVGIGTNTPSGKLIVKGDSLAPATEPLFEVKNGAGEPVFVVYPDSVRIIITQSANKATAQGGFAVSGRSSSKGATGDLLVITPDSARIYLDESPGKATAQGGFAVSGRSSAKGDATDFLRVTADSTRIYTGDTLKGFGVQNISGTGSKSSYMQMTPKNYFIGHNSGKSISTGEYNSCMGFESGYSTNSGSSNTFLGYQSGKFNSSGEHNVFLGYRSGYYNTSGTHNVFVGPSAGIYNTTSRYNTFIGVSAGYSNTSSEYNTYVGCNSAQATTEGSSNAFFGCNSGYKMDKGSGNTFIGSDCGRGGWDGDTIITGNYCSDNAMLGFGAGYMIDNASSNVFLGAYAGGGLVAGYNNVFIGYSAGSGITSESEKLVIQNSEDNFPIIFGDFVTGNLGFGTILPEQKLHVIGNGIINNLFIGDVGYGISNWSGLQHSGITTANSYALIQSNDGFTTCLNKRGGSGAISFRIDNVEKMFLDDDGNLGIGATAPLSKKLEVTGSASVSGDVNAGSITSSNINGMDIGKIYMTTDGPLVSTGGGEYELYFDQGAGELKIINSSENWCHVWYTVQKGAASDGNAYAVSAHSTVTIIGGITNNSWGYEIHFGDVDGPGGWCSVWLQFSNGNLVGHYMKN